MIEISIVRVASVVEVRLGPSPDGPGYFAFKMDCARNWTAQLLKDYFLEKFQTYIQGVRREFYELGYKHGKGHHRKFEHFSCCV